jgi:hypothetical protein
LLAEFLILYRSVLAQETVGITLEAVLSLDPLSVKMSVIRPITLKNIYA